MTDFIEIYNNYLAAPYKGENIGGSYRGIPFQVINTQTEIGKRQALHQFLYQDIPYVEEFGRKARSFDMEIAVYGENHVQEAETLMLSFEETGSGILQHPYRGSIETIVTSATINDSTDSVGTTKINVTFLEVGEYTNPFGNSVPTTSSVFSDQTILEELRRIVASQRSPDVESLKSAFKVSGRVPVPNPRLQGIVEDSVLDEVIESDRPVIIPDGVSDNDSATIIQQVSSRSPLNSPIPISRPSSVPTFAGNTDSTSDETDGENIYTRVRRARRNLVEFGSYLGNLLGFNHSNNQINDVETMIFQLRGDYNLITEIYTDQTPIEEIISDRQAFLFQSDLAVEEIIASGQNPTKFVEGVHEILRLFEEKRAGLQPFEQFISEQCLPLTSVSQEVGIDYTDLWEKNRNSIPHPMFCSADSSYTLPN